MFGLGQYLLSKFSHIDPEIDVLYVIITHTHKHVFCAASFTAYAQINDFLINQLPRPSFSNAICTDNKRDDRNTFDIFYQPYEVQIKMS